MAFSACIFSHFDHQNVVAPYVFRYLEELGKCGFEVHFVSTCEYLPVAVSRRLESFVETVRLRPNRGLDFGAWKNVFYVEPSLRSADRLLFANDSVFGPLQSLRSILDRAAAEKAEVVGLTDSYEHNWHIQSYFFMLTGSAVRAVTERMFEPRFDDLDKRGIIAEGELRLGLLIEEMKLRPWVAFPYHELETAEFIRPRNPTHMYWDRLIERGYPFIKRELLRDNPLRVNLSNWRDTVTRHFGDEWVTSIQNELKRANASIDGKQRSKLRGRASDVSQAVKRRVFGTLPGQQVLRAVRRQTWSATPTS